MSKDLFNERLKMFYFGPWDRAGHFLHDESGYSSYKAENLIPWKVWELDGNLQPHDKGCFGSKRSNDRKCWGCSEAIQGLALIHHRDGWTALAFWDRSVDTRGASNSTYLAQGEFTFEQMVEMAKTRFPYRWNKMRFPVALKDGE